MLNVTNFHDLGVVEVLIFSGTTCLFAFSKFGILLKSVERIVLFPIDREPWSFHLYLEVHLKT